MKMFTIENILSKKSSTGNESNLSRPAAVCESNNASETTSIPRPVPVKASAARNQVAQALSANCLSETRNPVAESSNLFNWAFNEQSAPLNLRIEKEPVEDEIFNDDRKTYNVTQSFNENNAEETDKHVTAFSRYQRPNSDTSRVEGSEPLPGEEVLAVGIERNAPKIRSQSNDFDSSRDGASTNTFSHFNNSYVSKPVNSCFYPSQILNPMESAHSLFLQQLDAFPRSLQREASLHRIANSQFLSAVPGVGASNCNDNFGHTMYRHLVERRGNFLPFYQLYKGGGIMLQHSYLS